MVKYKNIGKTVKTFYGVEFKPGDIKSVKGFINDRYMVRVLDKTPESPVAKPSQTKPPVDTPPKVENSQKLEKPAGGENK